MKTTSALFDRNVTIENLRLVWQWCSHSLHPRWQRKRKSRNHCLIGIAYAIDLGESMVNANKCWFDIPEVYADYPSPLFDADGLLDLWDEYPQYFLELALGLHSKGPHLATQLAQIRAKHGKNPLLDSLAKKMEGREERYGDTWFQEGYHPEIEVDRFVEDMASFCSDMEELIGQHQNVLNDLARELLNQGPWRFNIPPKSWFVRKTPETLLNKMHRLILWRVAQKVLAEDLNHDQKLIKLCDQLNKAFTPSMQAEAESQGHPIDHVIDDMINFDMHKSREVLLA